MNIITGTTSINQRLQGQWLGILILLMVVSACSSATQEQEEEIVTKSDVYVTTPVIQSVDQSADFKGITQYLQSNSIRSQVSGIITAVNCEVAGTITTKQALFTIQPMEAAVLQRSNFNNELFKDLSDTIYSFLNGKISRLNVQVGDYVQIGDELATCIRSNSLRIITYVPL